MRGSVHFQWHYLDWRYFQWNYVDWRYWHVGGGVFEQGLYCIECIFWIRKDEIKGRSKPITSELRNIVLPNCYAIPTNHIVNYHYSWFILLMLFKISPLQNWFILLMLLKFSPLQNWFILLIPLKFSSLQGYMY